MPKGFSHIGLTTLYLDNTKDFYQSAWASKRSSSMSLRLKKVGNRAAELCDLRYKRRVQWVIVLRK